ncbi:MAG: DUF2236 domain-containing protein [Actinobacteria bacterium]|nr:DUF2236 domain-containing protein [Actinomycetota bacterium]
MRRNVMATIPVLHEFVVSQLQGTLTTAGSDEFLQPEFYAAPLGDPGLLGPDAVAWQVHADFPAMLIGGISALMLQSLHPAAMAGVVDHSDYQSDPMKRFWRTASFIAVTTFGSTEQAGHLIDLVRSRHDQVNGLGADGTAYDANVTRNSVLSYFDDVRGTLRATPAALDTVDFLLKRIELPFHQRPVYAIAARAAVDLLPVWARDLLGLQPRGLRDQITAAAARPLAWGFTTALRQALGPPEIAIAARARALR